MSLNRFYMIELKLGDVVYLNSEDRVHMTVIYINSNDKEIQCVYYSTETQEFKYSPKIPIAAVTKVM